MDATAFHGQEYTTNLVDFMDLIVMIVIIDQMVFETTMGLINLFNVLVVQ